jgi:hypothetical protein
LAGIVGIEPGGLTLRELLLMAEGRSRDNWAHTSAVLALVANVNRDPKKSKAYKPADFNPHVRKAAKLKTDIRVLKQVFVDNRSSQNHP